MLQLGLSLSFFFSFSLILPITTRGKLSPSVVQWDGVCECVLDSIGVGGVRSDSLVDWK